jgi:hypothetical protein
LRYILGGGIAGLIAAYYNKDYVIISDKIGGQMAAGGMGPRILEVNDNSTRLLEDLGFDIVPIKTARIGYKCHGVYKEKLTPEDREEYYLKSRNLTTAAEVPSSVMSDGKKEIKYFDINWNELIERLVNSITTDTIFSNAKKIDVENKVIMLDNGMEVNYEHIISTIPAPIFLKLSGLEPEEKLVFCKKVFILINENYIDLKDYDYIYFPCKDTLYHRISRVGVNMAAIEFTTTVNTKTLFDKWKNIAKKAVELPVGQIQSGKVQEIKGVTFVGRYACWNHDIKTDDVVEQANDIKVKLLMGEEL